MICPYYKQCGSCSYPPEDEKKTAAGKFARTKAMLKPYRVGKCFENPEPFRYRHKVIYHFAMRNGRLIAGFHPSGSTRVVEIEDCLIQSETAVRINRDLLQILNAHHLTSYNEKTGQGCLRHVLYRVSTEDKVLVCLVTATRELYGSRDIVKELRQLHPEIIGVDQYVQKRSTSIVIEGETRQLYGKSYLIDRLGEYRFAISASAFYQVNPKIAEMIYREAVEGLKLQGDEKALDLYCGIGTISHFLAPHVKEVTGIEINPRAVKDAVRNAELNGMKNIRFRCGDAGDVRLDCDFDVVVVDPPRSGLDQKLLRQLNRQGPKKIAYISCNPETLKRDLRELEKNYRFSEIELFDQFGFTDHLEAVCILTHI
ncbi:MAG: 23S rRNA (uracil(1939)-C(5))-methyltransferase RlmD [Erysipelotrichaceae bacterium]|nr:23S rRNA (uracil(1939)-C(5))-methyltransferase RlmD [Erysipelotrichaceae bacterium]